ncbi:MAG: PP2C family protein-serine/threonine phosphatase [bacterium]
MNKIERIEYLDEKQNAELLLYRRISLASALLFLIWLIWAATGYRGLVNLLFGAALLLAHIGFLIIYISHGKLKAPPVMAFALVLLCFLAVQLHVWHFAIMVSPLLVSLIPSLEIPLFKDRRSTRMVVTSILEYSLLLVVASYYFPIRRQYFNIVEWYSVPAILILCLWVICFWQMPDLRKIILRMARSKRWRSNLRKSFLLFLFAGLWIKYLLDLVKLRDSIVIVQYLFPSIALGLFLIYFFLGRFKGSLSRKIFNTLWYVTLIAFLCFLARNLNFLTLAGTNYYRSGLLITSIQLWQFQFGSFIFWLLLVMTYTVLQIEFKIIQAATQYAQRYPLWNKTQRLLRSRFTRYSVFAAILWISVTLLRESSILEPLFSRERSIKFWFPTDRESIWSKSFGMILTHNVRLEGYSLKQYLTVCDTLVPWFEAQGVRAVVIAFDHRSPHFEDTIGINLLKKLNRYRSVLFSVEPKKRSDDPWIDHPVLDYYNIPWYANTLQVSEDTHVSYYRPYGYRHTVTGEPKVDIAFASLARINNDTTFYHPRYEDNHVTVSNIRIPVNGEGLAPINYHVNHEILLYDKLEANYYRNSSLMYQPKIVFIEWQNPEPIQDINKGEASWGYQYYARYSLDQYYFIMKGILNNAFIIPLNGWIPFSIFLVIVICALIFMKYPNRVAFPISALLFFIIFLTGYILAYEWAYDLSLTEPIVATLLSMLVFPVLRISDDRRVAEERRRSIEEAEKLRLLEELRAAHDMQMGLMPVSDPVIEGFDISGRCIPASEVGGDYFDYLWMNEEKTKFGIAIADVSGHAMKAAITAVMTSGMIYREIGNNKSPKEILTNINTPMYLKTTKNTFTALSIAVLDLDKKMLTLSNAGQTQPILKRGNTTSFLKVDGNRYPLGVKEQVEYSEMKIQLQPDDLLVFYTDGIVEAMNEKKELYGFERLEQKIQNLANGSAKEILEAMLSDVEKFVGSTKPHDDMTVVVVKVL